MKIGRPAVQLPEAGRFWIRYAPRAWEVPSRPWLDLARARLGESSARRQPSKAAVLASSDAPDAGTGPTPLRPAGSATGDRLERAGEELEPARPLALELSAPGASRGSGDRSEARPEPGEPALDDLLYLPPVPRDLAAARDDLAASHLARGTPVLVQLLAGEETALPVTSGAAVVVDLLAALLGHELDRLLAVPGWATAVWPLVPGLTDEPSLWERGCRRLAGAGVRRVQAMAPSLSAADRRHLSEGAGEAVFDALFHRPPPAERDFARVAHRHGLAPFLPRPLPRPPLGGAENRRIAGLIALCAELWLRLGRGVEQGQALYRAARWVDRSRYDLELLSRQGNLVVISALDPFSREMVTEAAGAAGEPVLLGELLGEYLEQAPRETVSVLGGAAGGQAGGPSSGIAEEVEGASLPVAGAAAVGDAGETGPATEPSGAAGPSGQRAAPAVVDRDIGQVPEALVEIEPIANDK